MAVDATLAELITARDRPAKRGGHTYADAVFYHGRPRAATQKRKSVMTRNGSRLTNYIGICQYSAPTPSRYLLNPIHPSLAGRRAG